MRKITFLPGARTRSTSISAFKHNNCVQKARADKVKEGEGGRKKSGKCERERERIRGNEEEQREKLMKRKRRDEWES